MDLKAIAAKEYTHTITLRGEEVAVRNVPSRVVRLIEQKITEPPVYGENQKAVEEHKAKPEYQEKLRMMHHHRQCLRTAYAARLTFDGLGWSDDMKGPDAVKLAMEVSATLGDGEIAEIYDASNQALKVKRDPKNAIGTENTQGN